MLARPATSSRRSPGVRRRGPAGSPASAGLRSSRRSRRKRASSCLAIRYLPPRYPPPRYRPTQVLVVPGSACPPAGRVDTMNNSTALVTGANKGIGKQIARQLADAGLTVYVASRDAGRGQQAVDEIGGGARLLVLDVTEPKSIADAAQQVENLDILVNNAGIMVDGSTAPEADVESFRRTDRKST